MFNIFKKKNTQISAATQSYYNIIEKVANADKFTVFQGHHEYNELRPMFLEAFRKINSNNATDFGIHTLTDSEIDQFCKEHLKLLGRMTLFITHIDGKVHLVRVMTDPQGQVKQKISWPIEQALICQNVYLRGTRFVTSLPCE